MKKKIKGSRSWSRVLATQALYQLSLNKNIDISLVKKNLLKDKETKNIPDRLFFFKLVNETLKNKKTLDKKLEDAVKKKNFSKMETIIKVILELGLCEIVYFKDLSHKISIAEYNKVSSSFLNKNEVGLINGILDKIANNIINE
ncbi:MAG: transcription antitermination factor NusB [Alphaproteobacteria bacterium]|nr:transcription antitermination factor NusB [Alphaproteobacteria bacterium]